MSPDDLLLKDLLDELHDRFDRPEFIEKDPVSIPHLFSKKEDIEIAGFLTALIAWGNRLSILQSARKLLERMDHQPHEFVLHATSTELAQLRGFVHRTFNETDARGLIFALRQAYRDHGGLEGLFTAGFRPGDIHTANAIAHVRGVLTGCKALEPRSHKHLADPMAGSSAKRLNMYLRWMVRDGRRGVDFGLWKGIDTHQLVCPLDVHTATVARGLGLLDRKQNDWKSALLLTERLKQFDPADPVKYDFSLFGLGVSGEWKAFLKSGQMPGPG